MNTVQPHRDLPAPTRTLMLSGQNVEQKRAELLAYFIQTWALYEDLFTCINDQRAWPHRHVLH